MNQNEIKRKEETVDQAVLLQYLKTLNQHLSDVETNQFLQISIAYGLNPFKREIYASKYGGNFSIVVGYETYIKRAERSGLLDGWKVTTSGSFNAANPKSSDLKAVITIFRSDFKHPFEHEVEFAEYCQFTKEGQVTKFWKEKPITMIKKVAISQGFRLCFSDELGGLPYTKEEIGQEEATFTTVSSEPLNGPASGVKIETPVTQAEPIRPEINVEEEAKKKEAILQNALKVVENATTVEGLRRIWTDFQTLQTEKRFSSAVNEKKKSLEAKVEEESVQEAEVVSEETKQNESSAVYSNASLAKDAINAIKEMTSVDQIEEFVTFETRETVIQAKEQRIEFIKNKTLFEDEQN